jgi:uncharacterized membrane protein YesL
MSSAHASSGWAIRAQQGCEWILWVVQIQAAWLIGTLAGGIVLGIAPASVAAATLTRRRLRGEAFGFVRAFAHAWRAEFVRANVLVMPVLVATVILAIEAVAVTSAPLQILLAVAAVIAAALATVLVPLYVHYDLPLRAYPGTALRWMLRNAAGILLLACAAAAIGGASWLVPGLVPFVTIGAWSVISTALCLGLFAANDRVVAEVAASR